jgi:hypothetical protein
VIRTVRQRRQQLRAFGRQGDDGDVVGHVELGGGVPARLVQQQRGMAIVGIGECAEEEGSAALAAWLTQTIDAGVSESYIEDFIEDQLLTPEEFRNPPVDLISQLTVLRRAAARVAP